MLVGASGNETGATDAGSAYVFYGPPAAGIVSVNSADLTLTGAAAGDQFGRALAFADGDGDGLEDLVVGADQVDNGAAVNSGAAYVFPSSTASGDATLAVAGFTGVTGNDYVGRALSRGGDINGDGAEDLLVAAIGLDSGATGGIGGVYVLHGPFVGTSPLSAYGARLEGSTAADAVGYAVAGGSDTDSDGFADVLLSSVATDSGSFNNNGAAWLFFGGGL